MVAFYFWSYRSVTASTSYHVVSVDEKRGVGCLESSNLNPHKDGVDARPAGGGET